MNAQQELRSGLEAIDSKAYELARGLSFFCQDYDELRERLEFEAEDFVRSLTPEVAGRFVAEYGREVSLTPKAIEVILETEQQADGVFISLCIELLIDKVWQVIQMHNRDAFADADFGQVTFVATIQ
jgi:hypothetical protein